MLAVTANFISVWEESVSIAEVMEKTGLKSERVRNWASRLRKRGVELKKMYPPKPEGPKQRKRSMAVTHENEDPNWQTPDWIVEAARSLMDEIDLDPASDTVANKRIEAAQIFTEQDDGLKQTWGGPNGLARVFLNPPGRQVLEFWDKLIEEWDANRVWMAFWVGFNVDHLRWISTRQKHPLAFYTCIPLKRVQFERGDGAGKNPSCANYLTWLPDEDCSENWAKFCEVMGPYGRCIRGSEGFYSGERYVKHPYAGISFRNRRINQGLRPSDGDSQGSGT